MSLSDELVHLIPEKNQEVRYNNAQLELADEIEKTLETVGIQLQQRFDIPLSARITSMPMKVTVILDR